MARQKVLDMEKKRDRARRYAGYLCTVAGDKKIHAWVPTDELELELKELEVKLKDVRRKLESVSNNREYQSLYSEMNLLNVRQDELEQSLIATWNSFETAQRACDTIEKKHSQQVAALNTHIQEIQEKKDAIMAEIASMNALRSDKLVGVPEEWLEKYAAMRSRVADPMVPVQYESCSACFQTIIDQDMLRLKRCALLQCKGCYRFLFLKEAMEQQGVST